jgi:hypothetical protein
MQWAICFTKRRSGSRTSARFSSTPPMEKIMRKTNDTSSPALEDHRPLADCELDAVTGGSGVSWTYTEQKPDGTK